MFRVHLQPLLLITGCLLFSVQRCCTFPFPTFVPPLSSQRFNDGERISVDSECSNQVLAKVSSSIDLLFEKSIELLVSDCSGNSMFLGGGGPSIEWGCTGIRSLTFNSGDKP